MAEAPETVTKRNKKTSIIYLGHIPPSFEEVQMRKFFTQFGNIKNLRLSRNKKTGASKHYAFVEFDTPDVAEIVAETMNNYILFGHRLVCEVMKADKVNKDIWKGANKKFFVVNGVQKAAVAMNKQKTPEQIKATLEKKLKKCQEQIEKMKSQGQDTAVLEETCKSYEKSLKELEKKEKVVEKKEKVVEKKEKVVEKKEKVVEKKEMAVVKRAAKAKKAVKH